MNKWKETERQTELAVFLLQLLVFCYFLFSLFLFLVSHYHIYFWNWRDRVFDTLLLISIHIFYCINEEQFNPCWKPSFTYSLFIKQPHYWEMDRSRSKSTGATYTLPICCYLQMLPKTAFQASRADYLRSSCQTTQNVICNLIMYAWTCEESKISAFLGLRWLDTVFQGQYTSSLSLNYVAINKVLEKLPPQLYYIKMEICYDQSWHWSCHNNEMMPLPILLAAVFLVTGNSSSKLVHGSFFLQYPPRCWWSLSGICKSVIEIFWDGVSMVRNTVKKKKKTLMFGCYRVTLRMFCCVDFFVIRHQWIFQNLIPRMS